MKNLNTDTILIEAYYGLIKNLSHNAKLDLIARLSESLKTKEEDEIAFKDLYGAFKSDKSAEEQIEEIRNARVFKRKLEE